MFSSNPPLGLYIHLPWCEKKCPYCDFNSYQAEGAIPEQEYVDEEQIDGGEIHQPNSGWRLARKAS